MTKREIAKNVIYYVVGFVDGLCFYGVTSSWIKHGIDLPIVLTYFFIVLSLFIIICPNLNNKWIIRTKLWRLNRLHNKERGLYVKRFDMTKDKSIDKNSVNDKEFYKINKKLDKIKQKINKLIK